MAVSVTITTLSPSCRCPTTVNTLDTNGRSNSKFYHGIEKLGSDGTNDPRISLTFRQIGTYYDPHNGAVWGTGAIAKTRKTADDRVAGMRSLSPAAKLAKDRDEADLLLQLFRAENIDDRFDPNSYQPGFDILDFQSFEN